MVQKVYLTPEYTWVTNHPENDVERFQQVNEHVLYESIPMSTEKYNATEIKRDFGCVGLYKKKDPTSPTGFELSELGLKFHS